MKPRSLAHIIQKASRTFPAVVVTGPRQSGKTTLLKNLLENSHQYLNLEDPDTRIRAKEDPRNFLAQCNPPAILDEIQYVPELLPFIKTRIDEKRSPGQWVLTGSQNFVLMQGVSESLAGRAAVLSLLPFSLPERIGMGMKATKIEFLLPKIASLKPSPHSKIPPIAELFLRGGYPEIASQHSVDKDLWCGSYISTYIERDIRNLSNLGDLNRFERFLKLCATRTGQILNASDLAREIGISVPTVNRWISLLETGYQIFLLYPYYRNIGKRLVKSPKLYFNDTALVCYLLGLKDKRTLLNSPYFPHIFETFVVTEFWKRFLSFGQSASLYYLRTRDGLEIDLVVELKEKLYLFEIKSSATIYPAHAGSLVRALRDLKNKVKTAAIISASDRSFSVKKGIFNIRWQDLLSS